MPIFLVDIAKHLCYSGTVITPPNPKMMGTAQIERELSHLLSPTKKHVFKRTKSQGRLTAERSYKIAIVRFLRKRDGELCQICHMTFWEAFPEIDHIIPVSKGGTDSLENFQLAHRKCNLHKGSS